MRKLENIINYKKLEDFHMFDLDDRILKELQIIPMTTTELECKIDEYGSSNRIVKRMRMLRKWGLVDFQIVDNGKRGNKPMKFSLSKKAKNLMKNH